MAPQFNHAAAGQLKNMVAGKLNFEIIVYIYKSANNLNMRRRKF